MLETLKKLNVLFTSGEKKKVGLLMCFLMVVAFFQALSVVSILPFMSMVMNPETILEDRWINWAYLGLGFTEIGSFIVFSGVLVLGILVAGNAMAAFTTWYKLLFVWEKNHNLSMALLNKYLSQPYPFFLDRHSSDLCKNILGEVNALTSGLMIPILNLITRSVVVVSIAVMLILVNPLITLLTVLLLGFLYGAIYLFLRKKLKSSGKKMLEANQYRYFLAYETFGLIKDIKVLGKEFSFQKIFSKHSKEYSFQHAWNSTVSQLPRYFLETMAFGGVIVLTLYLLSVSGEAHLVIPMVSLYAFAGYRLMPSLQEVFQAFAQIQVSQAVLNKIYDDYTEKYEMGYMDRITDFQVKPLVFQEKIELQKVSFRYPNSDGFVIEDLNMTIYPKTSIALVGSTGSGKTTVADIILGLLMPQEGSIKVDDEVIDGNNIRNWQRNMGYVSQNIYLLDDTLIRNIAFGVPQEEVNIAAVEKAARIANIHDFIVNELPQGYNSLVGERGVRLSGGQRQRVGIARALYHDPQVLVMDEATSALDGETEKAVLSALDNVSLTKNLIIIAHRFTTVKNCDLIYMLEKGKVISCGTYDELISSNSHFKSMSSMGVQ
ncbi:ABC transporter ATP-binding protein [Candidatus Contubernalis alkaliaceticus]|uniref:ABC transporter ATP-binding protein n=1 Tax=Candidatus Contubernalis alkaliaceticus TaxID=338645 RepID=UPI001F4C48AC|nr:ABC transporter ATP-binding protein [Candidatus Contubernalis alkalaceticus]UNC93584.1 ABC transporter ATP-binding protein [Candidatus Contubernalis alkalaceticus]